MRHHIQDFTVHDYKGIHELSLTGLGSINILTGNNNSGKTSLLELLSTTLRPQSIRSWLAGMRMTNSRYTRYYNNTSFFEALYNMFPCNQKDKHISYDWIQDNGAKHSVQMDGVVFQDQLPESELNKINGIISASAQTGKTETDELIDVKGLKLLISTSDSKQIEMTIYDKQRRLMELMATESNENIIFISSMDYERYLDYLNVTLQTPNAYTMLLEMLKFFDESIIGLNAIKSDDSVGAINYLIQSKTHSRSLPLSAYGDGLKKSVLLLSALAQAKDGILLIDEFETGIHTSCMDKVFSLLLENALKFKVQVFLTSHSKEAISKLLHLSKEIQDNMTVYTLYDYDDNNLVRRAKCLDAIKMQEQLGMELR